MRLSPFAVVMALVIPALATPAFAEDINDTGWKISCDDAGCQIASGGFALWTTAGSDPAALQALQSLPDMSAVNFLGVLQNMGDSTADLVLAFAERADNINEGNLQVMQGDWKPVGEQTPYFIRIIGMEYQEWTNDEMGENFAMIAGDSCADGTAHTGTVISLYRLGDDPDADGCWQVEYVDAKTLSMRDVAGDFGVVDYTRIQN
jgi:hypothetical protein